jgi:hypothetical protein
VDFDGADAEGELPEVLANDDGQLDVVEPDGDVLSVDDPGEHVGPVLADHVPARGHADVAGGDEDGGGRP